MSHLSPAVRAVQKGAWKSVKVIAAESAFWSLKVSFLAKFAALIGCPLPPKPGIVELLLGLVTFVLKVSEDRAMEIIAQRMSLVGSNSRFQLDVLDLDDAESVLDKHDRKVAKDEKNRPTRM